MKLCIFFVIFTTVAFGFPTKETAETKEHDTGIMTVSAKPAANSTSISAAERERAANIITDFVGGARNFASTLADIFLSPA